MNLLLSRGVRARKACWLSYCKTQPDAIGHPGIFGIMHLTYYVLGHTNSFSHILNSSVGIGAQPKYLSDSFHWPLAVHLKDATLCSAGHPQLMPCAQSDLLLTPVAQIITFSASHPVRIFNRDEKVRETEVPYGSSSGAAVKSKLYVSVHQVDGQEVSAACVITVQQRPVRRRRPKCQLKLHKGQITLRGLRPWDDSI